MLWTSSMVLNITSLSDQIQLNLAQLAGATVLNTIGGAAAGDQAVARASFKGVWESPVPIVLAANTNFKVEITHDTAPNAALDNGKMMIALVGILDTGR
jgi:hypothetical protein